MTHRSTPNFFWTKIFFRPKIYFWTQNFSQTKKVFMDQIFFSDPNFFFGLKHFFESKISFAPKNFKDFKFFETQYLKKNWTQNFFSPVMNFNECDVWREKTKLLNLRLSWATGFSWTLQNVLIWICYGPFGVYTCIPRGSAAIKTLWTFLAPFGLSSPKTRNYKDLYFVKLPSFQF